MNAAVPTPEDEGQHPPETSPHWSESWYFDAVSDDGSLGVYTRIGRVPGTWTALYTAAVVRPDGELVLILDQAAPLPDDVNQTVRTEAYTAWQECVTPLQEFSVHLDGTGTGYKDHVAPLRQEPGSPLEIGVDLTFTTDGLPYRWQLTDRYEVPCRVTGTVRIGTDSFAFSGPGQRDHSWGPRDWWGHEWMWSAFHFSDGTRTHAVAISELPGLMIGYAQLGNELVELAAGACGAVADAEGIPVSDRIELTDVGLTLDVRPIAYAPLRLVSDEGRTAWFIRAMAEVTTGDGRRGTGWIEWNRLR